MLSGEDRCHAASARYALGARRCACSWQSREWSAGVAGRFGKPKLKHLKHLAIDEISTAKEHRYPTIVMDLDSGTVVHVGRGKGGDALTNFWTRLRRSGAKIEAVATDMSPAHIGMPKTFAKTLRIHAWQILAWYDHPISTGPLEETSNKIKTMKRQAYGFRDQEFFRLKILGIHESKYALVG